MLGCLIGVRTGAADRGLLKKHKLWLLLRLLLVLQGQLQLLLCLRWLLLLLLVLLLVLVLLYRQRGAESHRGNPLEVWRRRCNRELLLLRLLLLLGLGGVLWRWWALHQDLWRSMLLLLLRGLQQ